MKTKYSVLLQYKDFQKNLLSSTVNVFGDCFDALAVSMLIYHLTGSKLWFALNFAINALPNLIIQPFAGPFIERFNKKYVMMLADTGRAVLVLSLIVLSWFTELNPVMILVFTFLMTCMEAFRAPAAGAILPFLIEREHYDVAISFKQSVLTLAQVVGTALAGTVIALWGVQTALWVDFLSFILSILITAQIKTKLDPVIREHERYVDTLKGGLSYFLQHPFIFKLASGGAFISLLLTGINVMLFPTFIESFKFDAQLISIFNALMLSFTILSSLLYPKIHEHYTNQQCFGYGVMLLGLAVAAIGFMSQSFISIPFVLLIACLMGFSIGLFQSTLSVSFVSSVAPEQLSRAAALFNSFSYAASPLGSLLIAGVILILETELTFLIYGIMIALISFYFIRSPHFKAMD